MMTIILVMASIFFGIQIEFISLKNNFAYQLLILTVNLLIVGVLEEFYFRGLIFNTLIKNNFGFHLAALISSILFSIMHWSSFDMNQTSWLWYIGIVFIGYILVYIYTYTNSIWSAVFFHFCWNFIAYLMDGRENQIGLFTIGNYDGNSKTVDNITVVFLGMFLVLILYLTRKNNKFNRINSFVNQLNIVKVESN